MEQAKIRPSVTLYSLDRSLPYLVWLQIWRNGDFLRFQMCNYVDYNRFNKLRFFYILFQIMSGIDCCRRPYTQNLHQIICV